METLDVTVLRDDNVLQKQNKRGIKMISIGWHRNLSMEQYHLDKNTYSKSSLSDFEKLGPKKFHYNRENHIGKKSNAFDIGSAVHTLILEPHKFSAEITTIPQKDGKPLNKNSNAYKAWAAENADKIKITQAESDTVKMMRDAVMEEASQFFEGGQAEVAGVFQHETGIMIKFRPDYIPSTGVLVDLKTTNSFNDFITDSYKFKYHWSAALSTFGADTLSANVEWEYYFVVVDKNPPHEVAIYKTPDWLIDAAHIEMIQVIQDLSECVKSDVWPSKNAGLQWLDAPKWVKRMYYAD